MAESSEQKALVVLSGGQDSTLCLGWAKTNFQEVHALTFDYDQLHQREVEAARTVASIFGVASHEILKVGPILEGTSPLVNKKEKLETYDSFNNMVAVIGDRIEKTFVPMRNAFFLTVAANRAVARGCMNLVTGVCEADTANYPDCRAVFIKHQARTINAALGMCTDCPQGNFKIHTPLLSLSKPESCKIALSVPGVYRAWAYSHTSYDGQFPPIGKDHATMLRAEGFRQAELPDPLVVRAWLEHSMDLPETSNYDLVRAKIPASIDELVTLVGARDN